MTLADGLNLALAVATVLMAGATVYLAYYTHKLAKDTAKGIKQVERHHQDGLRPLCVFEFANSDANNPFGGSFYPGFPRWDRISLYEPANSLYLSEC